jgi:hypothetical protein
MNQIAEAIYEQLGGSRFQAMVGPRDLMHGADFLSMHLPKNRAKATHLRIRLQGNDLYEMVFSKVRFVKGNLNVVEVFKGGGIDAENLTRTFEMVTGLATHL